MKNMKIQWVCIVVLATSGTVHADVKSRAIQEVAEEVLARFGSKAGTGLPALAQKIESYVARFGEEMLPALRRVGPEAFGLVDAAGVNGARAAQILAVHGEEGATWILRRPKAMSQVLRLGEDAVGVLVKHPGVAEPLVERGGQTAVKALGAITTRNGRRVAMMMEGDLGKVARSTELFDIIARFGNRAAEYVWENKGALAVGTALVAFLAEPELFLNGTKELAKVAEEMVAKPLAEGVARGTNWTPVVLLVVLAVLGCCLLGAAKLGLFTRAIATVETDKPAKPA